MPSRPPSHKSIRATRARTQTASQGSSSPPSSPSTMRSESPSTSLRANSEQQLEREMDINIPSVIPTTELVEQGIYSRERESLELAELERAQERQFEARDPLQLHERYLPSSILQNDSQGPSLHRFMTESAQQREVREEGNLFERHRAQRAHLHIWYNLRREMTGAPEYDISEIPHFRPTPVVEETNEQLRQRHRSETYAIHTRFRREENERQFLAETQEQLEARHIRELREMSVRHTAEETGVDDRLRRERSWAPSPTFFTQEDEDDARRRRGRSRAPSPPAAFLRQGRDNLNIVNTEGLDFPRFALGNAANREPGLAYGGSGLRGKENCRPH